MEFGLYPANQQQQFTSPFVPAWINTEMAERLWSRDQHYLLPGTHVQVYTDWFGKLGRSHSVFYMGCATLDGKYGIESLQFTEGSYQSRWLLDCGVSALPLALDPSCLRRARSIGLIVRMMVAGETLMLPLGQMHHGRNATNHVADAVVVNRSY